MSKSAVEMKKQVVEEIRSKIADAKSVVLVDYRGLNVEEVTELRNKYREAGVEYKVYKNNMMKFAFEAEGLGEFNKNLTGPNAIAISREDAVSAAKVTHEFAKSHKALELKAGIVEGEVLDLAGISRIAELPSREVLLTQLVIGLNDPIASFARVLQAVVDKNGEETTEA